MKAADQVTAAAAAANSMLGRIHRAFTCLDMHPPPPALYKALVHPKMEFAIQASTKERHRQS